jgi:hypothetical protein
MRGTTSYQGKYPKEQVKLECPAETEEDHYYRTMLEKSTPVEDKIQVISS